MEEKFNPLVIDQHFSNIEFIPHLSSEARYVWSVMDVIGNQTGTLTYHRNHNQWDFFVDNFPSQKKYYSHNLPVRAIDEFMLDVSRSGLVLLKRS